MKKTTLIALTCAAFLLTSGLIISSCSKDSPSERYSQNVNRRGENPVTVETISGDGLYDYEARFVYNEDGSKSITFAEPEELVTNSDFASQLGFSSLTLASGLHTINVSVSGVSTLNIPIVSWDGWNGTQPSSSLQIGIYIAKVHKKKCGGQTVTTDCLCGIGFNCGLVKGKATTNSATAKFVVNQDVLGNPTSISFNFVDTNINWKEIEEGN